MNVAATTILVAATGTRSANRSFCFFAAIMALEIASINSGSNGNCYYIGNETDAVLIDLGISCTEAEKRLKKLSLSISKIRAIFVSHEHQDHVKGVSTFANKYGLSVYITPGTSPGGPRLIRHISKPFVANEPVTVGSLTITGLKTQHDAADPHNFIVTDQQVTVGVFTDIGTACSEVQQYFSKCNAAFLEANYDETMLNDGPYSDVLKNRIRGEAGHLSNSQALSLFTEHRSPALSHLFLCHLSHHNNDSQLVESLFTAQAGNCQVFTCSRNEASPVFQITS